MAVTQTPVRRLAIQVVVGVAGVALIVMCLWFLSDFASTRFLPTVTNQPMPATVLKHASCQGADTRDTVSFSADGTTYQAKLDGCGHRQGEHLTVLVPTDHHAVTADTVVEPGNAALGDSSGLSHRVAFLLLIVSTAVGGAYSYFVYQRGIRRPRLLTGRVDNPAPPDEPEGVADAELEPGEHTEVNWFEDSTADGYAGLAAPIDKS